MKKFKQIIKNGRIYNIIDLPNTDYFNFEIVNLRGANTEKAFELLYKKRIYGLSHLVEHLSFKSPFDYSTEEFATLLNNEGGYNASTNHDRINYFFKTIMDNRDLAVNLVLNMAFNNLKNISLDEFEKEKKVVINEINRYNDDQQSMFSFKVFPVASNFDESDIVLGKSQELEKYTLQDAILLKELMNNDKEDVYYNIIMDSSVISIDDFIKDLDKKIDKFILDNKLNFKNYLKKDIFEKFLKTPQKGKNFIKNESEQSLFSIIFELDANNITGSAFNSYLSTYSNTSLNEYIREQHGLTYGLYFLNYDFCGKSYSVFETDVSKGDEMLLIDLFQKSIEDSIKYFNNEKYEKFIKARKLKRKMRLIDLENYNYWFNLAIYNKKEFKQLKNIAEVDLNKAYDKLDELYCSFDDIYSNMKKLDSMFKNKEYSICSNSEEIYNF